MKMYYVVNARLPNKKAYGIQIAKMCEAFIEAGVDLELVIPRTHAALKTSLKDFYNLRVDVPIMILPTVDWYARGRVGYYISATIFASFCFFYLLWERIEGKRGIFYSIPDTFSLSAALLVGMDCYLEIHEMTLQPPLLKLLRFARGLIATNPRIAEPLQLLVSGRPVSNKILTESNGVDLAPYALVPTRDVARDQLGIDNDKKIALYVGRFYEWKGLSILSEAAAVTTELAMTRV